MSSTCRRIPVHSSQTASRIYGGEAVIITPAENMVRMLNPTGSRIWALADGTRTIDDIATILATEYDVAPDEARRATNDLLDTLADKGLIDWA